MSSELSDSVKAVWDLEDLSPVLDICARALEDVKSGNFTDYVGLEKLLEKLWSEELLEYLDSNDETRDLIEEVLNDTSGETVGYYLGDNPINDPDFLKCVFNAAIKSGDVNLLCIVANNPNCPGEYLREIAKSEDGWEENSPKETVARNPNCPSDLLATFAHSVKSRERFAVAQNPSCPVELFEQLSHDFGVTTTKYYSDDFPEEMGVVLFAVASNPSTPVEILNKLAAGDLGEFSANSQDEDDSENPMYWMTLDDLKNAVMKRAEQTLDEIK